MYLLSPFPSLTHGTAPYTGPAGVAHSGALGFRGLGSHRLSWGHGWGWPLLGPSLLLCPYFAEAGAQVGSPEQVGGLTPLSRLSRNS